MRLAGQIRRYDRQNRCLRPGYGRLSPKSEPSNMNLQQ